MSRPAAVGAGPAPGSVPHTPHLLDFHDLRRPECLAFWSLMAICFGIGFLPRKAHTEVV